MLVNIVQWKPFDVNVIILLDIFDHINRMVTIRDDFNFLVLGIRGVWKIITICD